MQIKLSESPIRHRYPQALSPVSKSQIDYSLKTQRVKTDAVVNPLTRGHYINELSAKIQVMQQKIKDRSDYVSPSHMRSSERMVSKSNSNSFSKFNNLPVNKSLCEQEFKRSFQDNMTVSLQFEAQKQTASNKEKKIQSSAFLSLLEIDKISPKKKENQNGGIQIAQSYKFQIPPIEGLNRDKQMSTKSIFLSGNLNREELKEYQRISNTKDIFATTTINKSAMQSKSTKNLQPFIQNEKIANSINKSLNVIQMMKNLQAQKRPKKHKNSVDKFYCKQFEIGMILGKGKFGQVYLGKHMNTRFLVALKKVLKAKLKEFNIVDQFIKEIKLQNAMNHPNIVKFYGFFEEKDSFYLILEYMNGGTLFEYLNVVGTLKIKQAVQFLKDIIEAVNYMHQRSIAHRDIKPENIVISMEGVAKLCDFGWAAVVESTRQTYCGTLDYACPEVLQRKAYDISVDIWSIGVLTYEMLMGKAPFEDKDRAIVRSRIVNSENFELTFTENVPKQAREFIQLLIQREPSKRPKIDQLLSHKMFSVYAVKQNKKTF